MSTVLCLLIQFFSPKKNELFHQHTYSKCRIHLIFVFRSYLYCWRSLFFSSGIFNLPTNKVLKKVLKIQNISSINKYNVVVIRLIILRYLKSLLPDNMYDAFVYLLLFIIIYFTFYLFHYEAL